MAVRVLVVDDSRFFRRRATEMLESDNRIKVIGHAENGSEAVQMAARLKPDIITMDIEMPIMNGITATKRILSTQRVPILMFSSLTTEGAQATLDALDAGAVDYMPKRFEDISNDKAEARREICQRIVNVVNSYTHGLIPRSHNSTARSQATSIGTKEPPLDRKTLPLVHRTAIKGTPLSSPRLHAETTSQIKKHGHYRLVAIGTSTGGPVALQKVLAELPPDFPLPLVIVQHMPGTFTSAFAERLNSVCKITVKEARDGDVLTPGTALLAPGGFQMLLEKSGSKAIVKIQTSQPGQNYKPSVDITFDSIVRYEPAHTLAIIMTGMGSDGCEGARHLKQGGSTIWAQDESTCVVYGMPGSVVEAGLADDVLALDDIGEQLAKVMQTSMAGKK